MACDYCNSSENIYEFSRRYRTKQMLYVELGYLTFEHDDAEYEFSVSINYCPMCGRNLHEQSEAMSKMRTQ